MGYRMDSRAVSVAWVVNRIQYRPALSNRNCPLALVPSTVSVTGCVPLSNTIDARRRGRFAWASTLTRLPGKPSIGPVVSVADRPA